MQEGHAAAYAIKRQHTCSVVQVHAYPGGVGGGDGFVHPVVPGRVTCVGAEEAPGFVVVAQQTQRAFALPADAPVGHSDGELPAPLDLPVEAASGQGLPAQHLGEAVEPLRVLSVGLQVPGADDFSAVFRDVQLLVGCARVQFQLAEVWKRLIKTFYCIYLETRELNSFISDKYTRGLHFTKSALIFGSEGGALSTCICIASFPAHEETLLGQHEPHTPTHMPFILSLVSF